MNKPDLRPFSFALCLLLIFAFCSFFEGNTLSAKVPAFESGQVDEEVYEGVKSSVITNEEEGMDAPAPGVPVFLGIFCLVYYLHRRRG